MNLTTETELDAATKYMLKAIKYRELAKEPDITEYMRRSRLDMMAMYGRMSVCGGVTGSLRKRLA